MADQYDLACTDCRAAFWVGRNRVLFATENDRDALRLFLNAHQSHALRYDHADEFRAAGYLELEREDLMGGADGVAK